MTRNMLLLVALLPLVAQAQDIIRPEIGEPLRDAAVTRGPDGTFYLTGTRAMARRWSLKQEGKQAEYYLTESQPMLDSDGKPDFMNNDGAKVWSSKDLVNWTDEGLVWDLMKLKIRGKEWRGRSYALPERKVKDPRVRGLTSPKFFFHDGHWFVVESYGGHEIGLARSKGGDIGGPYEAWYKQPDRKGVDTRIGEHSSSRGPGHGSLFTDKDGSTYLVWGPGYIVKMKPDLSMPEGADERLPQMGALLSGPAEGAPKDLLTQVAGYPNAEWCAGQFSLRAASVTLDGDTYLLTWSAMTDGSGAKREDSFIATAKSLFGPYSEPALLAPGTGPVALFKTDNGLMASCSMDNAPVLFPLEKQGATYAGVGIEATSVKPTLPGKPDMFDYANSKPSGKFHRPHPETGRSKLVPVFDLPLSDTSIAKGGDGAWYMTGTAASKDPSPLATRPSPPDFENNDGIYLWRSEDLGTWLPLGKVWDIEKDGGAWQKAYRIPADNPTATEFARGVTAPEISFQDGTYWLSYSMNGRGTGLLKSKSGKPEGPYEDLGRITAMGGTPSMFVEEGEPALWLWGTLMAGELNADRTALAGRPTSLYLQLGGNPIAKLQDDVVDMWDNTAPHLFTAVDPKSKKKQYYLTFSAISQGTARALRDAFVARSDSPLGPYSSPILMIPQGGQTSVFEGPKGDLHASFYGADTSSVFRDRPGLVPLEFGYQDMPRKVNYNYYTRRGPWDEPLPISISLADFRLRLMPDDNMYLGWSMGLNRELDGGAYIMQSPDLKNWEMLKIYTHEQAAADPDFPAAQPGERAPTGPRQTAWATQILSHKGNSFVHIGMHNVPGKAVRTQTILKSASGDPAGPYEPYMFNVGGTTTGFSAFFVDEGVLLGNGQGSELYKIADDLKSIDTTWVSPLKNGGFQLKNEDGTILSTDIPGATGYGKIDGKYLWGSLNGFRGYCLRFWVSDSLLGPLREADTLAYAGNGNIAQFKDGQWYTTNQYMHHNHLMSAPVEKRRPILPVHVDLNGDDPVIEYEYDHQAGVREMSVYGEYE